MKPITYGPRIVQTAYCCCMRYRRWRVDGRPFPPGFMLCAYCARKLRWKNAGESRFAKQKNQGKKIMKTMFVITNYASGDTYRAKVVTPDGKSMPYHATCTAGGQPAAVAGAVRRPHQWRTLR